MANTAQPGSASPTQTGYRVECPRMSDAIGAALRDAFARDLTLPDDMMSLLRKLNVGSTNTLE